MKFDEFKQKAIAALVECPLKASEIAKATGANISSVYNWLKKLVISGDIVKGEDGVFRLSTNEELSDALIQEKVNEFMEQHFKPVEVEVIEERMPRAAMKQTTLFPDSKKVFEFSGVGQSPDRTLGKHKLLDKVLGRLTGAFGCIPFLEAPFIFVDLCAGDGSPSYFSGHSSPEIIQKHADGIRKKSGDDAAVVILVEQDRATFDKLSQSPHAKNAYLIHGNSKSPEVIEQIKAIIDRHARKNSPCFVHNDPNKVSDFAITSELLRVLPRYTTSLSTMGCNVHGLKRLPLADRRAWFDLVDPLLDTVDKVKAHDACLSSLVKDKHQWAYLLTTPTAWIEKTIQDIEKSFRYWERGVNMAWLSDRQKFTDLVSSLFLTKKELEGGQDVA